MRRVKRTKTPVSLQGPTSAGALELERARAFFKPTANRQLPFTFNAYKGDDVKEALRAMFERKCAYCESFYAPVMPLDIEHYRPKAAYIEKQKATKPGYWWLAMQWKNLLPSCADCNRAREQVVVGLERRTVIGKANQFPLAAKSVRAREEGAESAEVPLLLDPTVDNPTRHLEFLPNGTVRPTMSRNAESERGRATIETLALQRRDLVDARAAAALATESAILHVRETMADIALWTGLPGVDTQVKATKLAELRSRLDRDLADMEAKAAKGTPYSAVADAMIRAFKAEQGL